MWLLKWKNTRLKVKRINLKEKVIENGKEKVFIKVRNTRKTAQ